MAPPAANKNTLFHLIPTNRPAFEALNLNDNRRFVSPSFYEGSPLGLEVGYHVPKTPHGHVITRLGRSADLILRQSPKDPMSNVHVAFEINPSTHLIVLSLRSKRILSVTFSVLNRLSGDDGDDGEQVEEVEQITGDGVITYGINYKISIASSTFKLVWRECSSKYQDNIEALKSLALAGYQDSKERFQDLASCERPTEYDNSEALSWHLTRLNTTKRPPFEEIESTREEMASGAFGCVYKVTDRVSGNKFAIKKIKLKPDGKGGIEKARASVHREVKIMQRLEHVSSLLVPLCL